MYHCSSAYFLTTYFFHTSGLSTDPRNCTSHLKVVRSELWDVRAKWRDLGIDLGIHVDTCDVSMYVYNNYDYFTVIPWNLP